MIANERAPLDYDYTAWCPVVRLRLEGMGVEIDTLTERQEKYLTSWKEGAV